MSPRLRLAAAAAALVVTAGVVGVGVSITGGDDDPAAPPPSTPTFQSRPLDAVDTGSLTVLRASFCTGVPEDAVVEALGSEPDDASAYANGDRAPVTSSVDDVAHEYDCTWSAGSATARGWVFTPPVTDEMARDLTREAKGQARCSRVRGAPAFGEPSVALACRGKEGRTVSFRGLFGDAWLSCSLTLPGRDVDSRSALVDAAGRWCGSVATAAAAGSDTTGTGSDDG